MVRSVSGFAIDVLKAGPLRTVNHCPFLEKRVRAIYEQRVIILPLHDELALPQLSQGLLACFQCTCRVDFSHFQLCGVLDAFGLTRCVSITFEI